MNHKTTYLRVSDGTPAQSGEALDERGLLRDGFLLQRNVSMMDAQRAAVLSDEQRARKIADHEARNARLSNAWRMPASQPQQPRPSLAAELAALEQRPSTPPKHDADRARAERDRRLADAWRH